MRALCRRTSQPPIEAVRVGAGRLDLTTRDVILPDGTRVALSAREFALLRVLAARPTRVHSRTELRRRVFDEAAAASIVDTYVYYLRRKARAPGHPHRAGLGVSAGAL